MKETWYYVSVCFYLEHHNVYFFTFSASCHSKKKHTKKTWKCCIPDNNFRPLSGISKMTRHLKSEFLFLKLVAIPSRPGRCVCRHLWVVNGIFCCVKRVVLIAVTWNVNLYLLPRAVFHPWFQGGCTAKQAIVCKGMSVCHGQPCFSSHYVLCTRSTPRSEVGNFNWNVANAQKSESWAGMQVFISWIDCQPP